MRFPWGELRANYQKGDIEAADVEKAVAVTHSPCREGHREDVGGGWREAAQEPPRLQQ